MAESMIEVWTPEKGMRTLTEKELIEEFGEEELPSHKWESAPEPPFPWGDIPARPFLGLSAEDEDEVAALLTDYLKGALGTP